MREIKFRAWDKENGNMLHDVSTGTVGIFCSVSNMAAKGRDSVFMQYTGLKDKNGKEIFEGDILQPIDSEVSYAVVKFKDGLFVREWTNVDGGSSFSVALKEIPNHFEIIGNIYENPELIKK